MTEEINKPAMPEITPVQLPVDDLKTVKEKLTSIEKERFFKAFLADKPYVAEETLFSDKVQVKFTSLTVHENNIILLQMQYDKEKGVAKNTDAYLIKVIQYRIAASLIEIDHKAFTPDITEEAYPSSHDDGSTYLLKKLEAMKSWPIYKISCLTDAFNRFERKVRALTEESFKENF